MSRRAIGYVRGHQVEIDLIYVGKDTQGNDAYLASDVADNYLRMVGACELETGSVIEINTAYRDHGWQTRLWTEYQQRCRAQVDALLPRLPSVPRGQVISRVQSARVRRADDDWTEIVRLAVGAARAAGLPTEHAPLRPSPPGYSRHEAGRAFDQDRYDDQGRLKLAADWVDQHQGEYGFESPINSEPWHRQAKETK